MMHYDHAMLGATVALAVGAHRRHGWPLVVTAAVAAVVPDWDGLAILAGPEAHHRIHRAWGHNLLAALVGSGLVAGVGYLCAVSARGRYAARTGRQATGPSFSRHALAVWVTVGLLVSLSHLLMDVLYSGRRGTPGWPVALFWPFCERGWAYPVLSVRDWGATAILAGEMLALCFLASRARPLAGATLLTVFGYVAVRAFWPA